MMVPGPTAVQDLKMEAPGGGFIDLATPCNRIEYYYLAQLLEAKKQTKLLAELLDAMRGKKR